MQIDKSRVVSFHYTLTDTQNTLTETSRDGDPVAYLHGHGNIVPGLEKAMAGRTTGDRFTATIAPEDAYGARDEEAVQRVPIKHLVSRGKLAAGKVVAVNTTQGQRTGTVIKVGRFNVDLDLNHPLAGRTLVFDIEIVDVRDATEEEITHHHAHGPGGHNH